LIYRSNKSGLGAFDSLAFSFMITKLFSKHMTLRKELY
jgi:hypothetical protein